MAGCLRVSSFQSPVWMNACWVGKDIVAVTLSFESRCGYHIKLATSHSSLYGYRFNQHVRLA
jgi:hypothetical protein